jgi:alpha-mannosidase
MHKQMLTQQRELILVPHTHWDREWYQTFQQFRMRLVRAVDKVLEVLDHDPAFSYFMLDGQTIVLEDYLEVRPENAERLRTYARSGRLQVGPWYLQPDEFLVDGESLIRNLLLGAETGEAYGGVMKVGYVPDTFGHIAQLPQILRGFGIDNAIFWRGVGDEVQQSEFWWDAPDGSRVLVLHLADPLGYSNARDLPLKVKEFLLRLKVMEDTLLPKSSTGILLLMNGSDHLEPQEGLPAVIAEANQQLEDAHLSIGTLPQYVAAIKRANPTLQSYSGEWRSSQLAPLLPGVLSSRIWIKQRNAAVEHMLVREAEPLSAWAWALGEAYPAGFLRVAWRHLLHNHPHDSICGCSIDQVHREMVSRFDQSQQIAEGLIEEALTQLTRRINTNALLETTGGVPPAGAGPGAALVVFNPAPGPRTDLATAVIEALPGMSQFVITDASGQVVPMEVTQRASKTLFEIDLAAEMANSMLGLAEGGQALGFTILRVDFKPGHEEGVANVEVTVSTHGEPDLAALGRAIEHGRMLSEQPGFKHFHFLIHETLHETVRFLAPDLPSYGYKTFQVRAARPDDAVQQPPPELIASSTSIENRFYRVTANPENGTLSVLDKTSGATFSGLNRFEDRGDVGDLYTYCPPPAGETSIIALARPPQITLVEQGPVRATLRIALDYALPAACSQDRAQRSDRTVSCPIVSEVSLSPGIQRIDFQTRVENTARDHRLRVLFPVPFVADSSEAEGTFEVRRRPAQMTPPDGDTANWESWAELPVNTQPHKRFVDLSNGTIGLAVLNKGLPEYEVQPPADGQSSTLALTLLRCIEWLSRGDLSTRKGDAGPGEWTPDAQMPGAWNFEYALVPHAGDWRANDALVSQQAQAFNAPLRAIMADLRDGSLPLESSLITIRPGSIVLSSIKRAEREEALIARFSNPLETEQAVSFTLGVPFQQAQLVRLDETPLDMEQQARLQRLAEQELRVQMRAGEIMTICFRL